MWRRVNNGLNTPGIMTVNKHSIKQPVLALLAPILLFLNLSTVHYSRQAQSYVTVGIGGGHVIDETLYDDSIVRTTTNAQSLLDRKRVVTRPASMLGLCRVWWPVAFSAGITIAPLVCLRRKSGQWFVPDLPVRRFTIRAWMVLVAIVSIECFVWVESLGAPDDGEGLSTFAAIAMIQVLLILPFAIALLVRMSGRALLSSRT